MEELILDLHSCECIQFGKFTLKSKVVSPIYIDFKAVVSYPKIVSNIVDKFIKKIESINPDFKFICGVPYGGIVFSSLISNKLNIPMLIVRKEVKKYGMKRLIEGKYENKDSVLMVEDIISTGKSIIEFSDKLVKRGLKVKDILVICDRRLNHQTALENYRIHSLFTIHELLSVLYKNGRINRELFLNVYKFIIDNNSSREVRKIEYIKQNVDIPMKLKVVNAILSKKSNLCFNCIETDFFKFIDILGKVGNFVAIIMYNSGIINDFNYEKAMLLKKLAVEKNFILFDNLSLSNEEKVIEKQLNNTKNVADIVCVSTKFLAAHKAVKTINQINKKNIGIVFYIDDELQDCDKLKVYNEGNSLSDNLIGFYCKKRSVLMTNDLVFYMTDFLNTTNLEQPILLRNRNLCDIFIINQSTLEITMLQKIDNLRKICWNIVNGKLDSF